VASAHDSMTLNVSPSRRGDIMSYCGLVGKSAVVGARQRNWSIYLYDCRIIENNDDEQRKANPDNRPFL